MSRRSDEAPVGDSDNRTDRWPQGEKSPGGETVEGFPSRLVHLVGQRGNVARAAREMDVLPQTLHRWLDGSRTPSAEAVFILADRLQVSPRWLLQGVGPMRPGEPTTIPDGCVLVSFYDPATLNIEGRGDPSERVPIPRDLIPQSPDPRVEYWLTLMPSPAMPEVATEGVTIVCRDPEGELVDGGVYLFAIKGVAALVRRVAYRGEAPGLTNDTPSSWHPWSPDELPPVARIIGALRFTPA